MHTVTVTVSDIVETLADEALACDELGQLTPEAARLIKEAGVVRMLQPKEYGGFESHPREFIETVMELTSTAPSIGWVAGVVGVHPFEFGQADPRVQEEVWGEDHDVWTASPYAMIGQGRRVDGGYILNGQWPFSSGTDHCDWVVIGGRRDSDENPGEFTLPSHFMLPRADYEILQDSWDVMGLRGTGSKDIVVKDAFVPDYRVIDVAKLNARGYADENRPGSTLYQVPFDVIFPAAITAATVGIAEGLVHRFSEYAETRVSKFGGKATSNPYQMSALGAASADLQASRLHILSDVTAIYDHVLAGGRVTNAMQHEARRNQVRAARRASEAAQLVFQHAGGNASRLSNPIQRFHRDLSVAMGHACNIDNPVYAAHAGFTLGQPIPQGVII